MDNSIYKDFFENSDEIYGILNSDKVLEYCNKSVFKILGYKRDELVNRSIDEIIDTIIPDEIAATYQYKKIREIIKAYNPETPESGSPDWLHKDYRLIFKRKDGKNIPVKVKLFPFASKNRAKIGFEVKEDTGVPSDPKTFKHNQLLLMEFLNSLDNGLLIVDTNYSILYYNTKFTDFCSSKPELMKKCYRVILNREKPCDDCPALRSIESGVKQEKKDYIQDLNKWVRISSYPIKNLFNEKIERAALFINDITREKEIEYALSRSEQRYQKLFESANDAIFLMQDNRFVNCNIKAVEIFGCRSKDELIGFNPLDFSPEFQPDGIKSIQKAKHYIDKALNGEPQRFFWKHIKKDGTPFDTEVSLNVLEEDGKNFILAIVRDITTIKKARDQVAKLFQAVEQSPVSIVITDTMGNIEYVNPMFCKITGYSFEELIGKNPRVLKSGETTPEEYRTLWKTITSGKEWRGIFHNRRKDGTLYWESALIAPIKDSTGRIINFIGIKEDITERKNLESQLTQMQKLESIGTLTGGIAHDFNNILTGINGFAQLIISKSDKGSQIHSYATKILASGERAADLIKKLLAFSRKQMISTEVLDINRVIMDLDFILKKIIDEDINIKYELEKTGCLIRADKSQIEQILINLITNSRDALNQKKCKYTKTITIKTKLLPSKVVKELPHAVPDKRPHVLISVSDNGVGIDDEIKDRVFDPFFTTKPQWMGTGLGLSTVYGIVSQNKGLVYIETRKNIGTTVNILWPLSEETSPTPVIKPEKDLEENNTRKIGRETILMAEDNETVREFIYNALLPYGFNIISSTNGEEAIKMAYSLKSAGKSGIKLLISDIVMPRIGGIELYRKIKSIFPDIKVILITGYSNRYESTQEFEDDIYILHKPFKFNELINLVTRVLKKSSFR